MRFGGVFVAFAIACGPVVAAAELPAVPLVGVLALQANVPVPASTGSLASAGGIQLSIETRGWRGEWFGWGVRLAGGAEFKRPVVGADASSEWFLASVGVVEFGRLAPRGDWAAGVSCGCGPVVRFASGIDLLCSAELFFGARSGSRSSVVGSVGLQGASRFDSSLRPIARLGVEF